MQHSTVQFFVKKILICIPGYTVKIALQTEVFQGTNLQLIFYADLLRYSWQCLELVEEGSTIIKTKLLNITTKFESMT